MIFHHLGIAAASISEGLQQANKLFTVLDCSEIIHDENQNADLCMLTVEGGLQLELISGATVDSFVRKRQYLYHACFEVTHLDTEIAKLLEKGASLVAPPKPAVLFGMRRVAFVFCFMGIVELLEKENGTA